MTKNYILSKDPANKLEAHLKKQSPEMCDRALRYFLEYNDKGLQPLERRKERKLPARWVLEAIVAVRESVYHDQQAQGLMHIRNTLFRLAQPHH